MNFILCIEVFVFMCASVPHAFMVPAEVRRQSWISLYWNYRQLGAAMYVSRIKLNLQSFARELGALNH